MYHVQRYLSTDEIEAMLAPLREQEPRPKLCRNGLHPMVNANVVCHGEYKGKPRRRCKACYYPWMLQPSYLRRQALENALYTLRCAGEEHFPDLED